MKFAISYPLGNIIPIITIAKFVIVLFNSMAGKT